MQILDLDNNEKRLLDFTGIIIVKPNQWPINITEYNGIILSNIVISEKLVPNRIDRYYIAHYLRNQMHSAEKRYSVELKEFVPIAESYYFTDYDSYIKRKGNIICNVIFNLISKNFYKVYINYPDQCNSLLNDERLGIYLDVLKNKLKLEGLSFPLHYRM